MLTILQAIIIGLLQGVTELFPISSLGHSVIFAYLFGWHNVLNGTITKASSYLTFLVVVHVATALTLFFYFRKTWFRIIKAWFQSLLKKEHEKRDAKLAWLLISATIPAGLIGIIFQSKLQEQFAKPLGAVIFISINGLLLLYGDRFIKSHHRDKKTYLGKGREEIISGRLTFKRSIIIGCSQIFALFAGISRSGITMLGGVFSGLNRDEAAEFSFLLATPIILGAGLYKLPDVVSSKSSGMHLQMLAGAISAAIAAYIAVRFLDKYFKTKSYKPFGLYCLILGLAVLTLGIFRGNL